MERLGVRLSQVEDGVGLVGGLGVGMAGNTDVIAIDMVARLDCVGGRETVQARIRHEGDLVHAILRVLKQLVEPGPRVVRSPALQRQRPDELGAGRRSSHAVSLHNLLQDLFVVERRVGHLAVGEYFPDDDADGPHIA